MHCDNSKLLSVPIWVIIISDSSTRVIWQLAAEKPNSEAGKTWREIAQNFAYEVSLSYL
jgi:hypothetical protein